MFVGDQKYWSILSKIDAILEEHGPIYCMRLKYNSYGREKLTKHNTSHNYCVKFMPHQKTFNHFDNERSRSPQDVSNALIIHSSSIIGEDNSIR